MKCPFRIKIDSYKPSKDHVIVNKEFEDCYGTLCPFYVPEQHFDNYHTQAYCRRTDMRGKDE